ncbi:restriction endonuclease [Larkinella sp. C7]|jgi:restriction system protein|uniref:restriction endonuclease n=1 Tax=Larkinella sp. C7 TaxID=2576607 RepID=UPI001111121E|nr:restriction endonuclease [Larkinella sp. C7]
MTWKDYQNNTADFFKKLGMHSETDIRVTGVRGVHDIDVLVKFILFGIEIIWIVECKLWKKSIPKEKVLTLQQITQDVGADRAFLLSESGFQAGAIRVASNSNITLTSLDDLKQNSQDDLSLMYLKFISEQLWLRNEKLLNYYEVLRSKRQKDIHFSIFIDILANLFAIRTEIFSAISNNFPVNLYNKILYNYRDFLDECEIIFFNINAFIETNKHYYNEWLEQLTVESNRIIVAINNLLDLGRYALFKEKDFRLKEESYLSILKLMRQIDTLYCDFFEGSADSCSEIITHIMKILVIDIYKFITEPSTSYENWDNKVLLIKNGFNQLERTIHRLSN